MRKIFILLFTLPLFIACTKIYVVCSDDVEITENVIVRFINNNENNIHIPKSISGVQILGIGEEAFANKYIKILELPEGLISIGTEAFRNNELKAIIIPGSIEYIGAEAFSDNKYLTHIEFNENSNIKEIGPAFFTTLSGWDKYTKYSQELSEAQMRGTSYDGSTIVFVDNDGEVNQTYQLPSNANPNFVDYRDYKGNVYAPGAIVEDYTVGVFANIKHTLTINDVEIENGIVTRYKGKNKNIYVPESIGGEFVKGIGAGVFSNKYLVSIAFSEGLEWIGKGCFSGNCIMGVEFPPSLKYIGAGAFENNMLEDLSLPDRLKCIEANAFRGNRLKSLKLPLQLDSIKRGAFENNLLSDVRFPDNLQYIAAFAFLNNCFTEVHVENIASVNKTVFSNNKVERINGENTKGLVFAVNKFGESDKTIIQGYWNSDTIIDFIPNTVKKIDKGAFHFTLIQEVLLPNKNALIDQQAFDEGIMFIPFK